MRKNIYKTIVHIGLWSTWGMTAPERCGNAQSPTFDRFPGYLSSFSHIFEKFHAIHHPFILSNNSARERQRKNRHDSKINTAMTFRYLHGRRRSLDIFEYFNNNFSIFFRDGVVEQDSVQFRAEVIASGHGERSN